MFWVDIRDHGDGCRQFHERAVGFVGFDDNPVPVAEPGVCAVCVDDAAIDDGGVKLPRIHHRSDDGCGRRLAMGAGNRDAPFQAHDLSQHFGARYYRNQPGACLDDFGVVGFYRRRNNDDLGFFQVRAVMADGDIDSEIAEPQDIGAFGDVAALNGVAEIVQNFRNPAHADPADPDEMDGADAERQRLHAAISRAGSVPGPRPPLRLTPISVSAWSARAAAADDPPKSCAHFAASIRMFCRFTKLSRRIVRASGVKPACGINHPAPLASTARALAVW